MVSDSVSHVPNIQTTYTTSQTSLKEKMISYISSVPREMVRTIFSFLDHRSLVSVNRVCKKFHEIASDDALWKPLCLDYQSEPETYQDSWKSRFKIIKNWLERDAKIQNFFYTAGQEEIVFINSVPYIFRTYLSGSLYFDNLLNKQEESIEFDPFLLDKPKLTGNFLFFRYLNDEFSVFDFKSRQMQSPFKLHSDDPKELAGTFYGFSDYEVVTHIGRKVYKLWDFHNGSLKYKIDVSKIPNSDQLKFEDAFATPNFLIFEVQNQDKLGYDYYAVRKKDGTSKLIASTPGVVGQYFSKQSDCYFILWEKADNQIKVFKDNNTSLDLIQICTPKLSIGLSMYSVFRAITYKNWLLFKEYYKIHVFDIRTGNLLFDFTAQHNFFDFDIIGEYLSTRAQFHNILYDFTHPSQRARVFNLVYSTTPPPPRKSSFCPIV